MPRSSIPWMREAYITTATVVTPFQCSDLRRTGKRPFPARRWAPIVVDAASFDLDAGSIRHAPLRTSSSPGVIGPFETDWGAGPPELRTRDSFVWGGSQSDRRAARTRTSDAVERRKECSALVFL